MRTLLLVALLLAPAALADHVYSHRFVFEGRLVGSDGTPLPGREVEFFSEGEDFLEYCNGGAPDSVTNEWGDFRFCFHAHQIDPGTIVGARAGNASISRPVDLALRRTVVLLREPNETGTPPEAWARTYLVTGRAWQVGAVQLEGVPVFGTAVTNLPVNLTVHAPGGSDTRFETRTNGFGDFALEIETEAEPADVSLTLEALGRAQPTQLDATFHRTHAPIYVPPPEGAAPEQPAFERGAGAPGSTTPRVNPVLVVAVALALIGAIALSKRKTP